MPPMSERSLPLLFRNDAKVSQVAARTYAGEILKKEATMERKPYSIDHIQTLLREKVGVELDLDLVFQMGMEGMDWQGVHHPRALYGLFVGRRNNGDERIPLQGAEALIAVTTSLDNQGAVLFDAVDATGTTQDSAGNTHVLALRYNANCGKAKEAIVSVTKKDLKDSWKTYRNTQVVSIPTSDKEYEWLGYAGGTPHPVTTSQMVSSTDGHSDALLLHHDRYSHLLLGETTGSFGGDKEVEGFYETPGLATRLVGLREDHPDRWKTRYSPKFHTVWEVSYPNTLVTE